LVAGSSREVLKWPGLAQQNIAYEHFSTNFLTSAVWSGFLDADEFVLTHGCDDLREFLVNYQTFSGLAINWQCFGSNGHEHRPKKLILESYNPACRLRFQSQRPFEALRSNAMEWPSMEQPSSRPIGERIAAYCQR
jgi:hypothetical protein